MTIRKRGQHYQVDVYTPQGRVRKAAYSLEQAEALEIILRNNAQYIEKYRGRIKRIQADTKLLDALECTASVRWKDSRLGAELKATAKRTIKKYWVVMSLWAALLSVIAISRTSYTPNT